MNSSLSSCIVICTSGLKASMFAHENKRLVSGMPHKSTSLAVYAANKKLYQSDITPKQCTNKNLTRSAQLCLE